MDPHISCSTCLTILYLIFSSSKPVSLQTALNQYEPFRYLCPKIKVELTISPLVGTKIHLLQLTWRMQEDPHLGDYVALYQEDPSNHNAKPLYQVLATSKEGWVTSDIEDKSNFTNISFTPQCLGYWIAYRNASNAVLASSCLKTEPQWMETYKEDIQNITLKQLFLPGTHNSGSFLESSTPFYETRVHKYVYTQDQRVLHQLIHGVRYLDLRVGYYHDTEDKWWLNHDFFRVGPLKYILDDIILFVNNTKEIVVVDIHAFPVGFTMNPDKTHSEFIDYLMSYFGNKLIPVLPGGWKSTLNSIWETERQIILSYNKAVLRSHIWSPVTQKWGNVQSLDKLKSYLDEVFLGFLKYPWAAMAELTPNVLDVVTDRLGGLRNMAVLVNRNVTRWFQGHHGRACNIVAVDFVRNTGIVEAAIQWNRKKGLQIYCD